MRHIYLFVFLFTCSFAGFGQYSRHIIQLKDKKGTGHTIANPSTYLSSKAIQRRLSHNIIIDSTDLPLPAAYLDSIASISNVVIYNKSKWLNQVLIRTNDPAALAKINSFSFVKSTKQIATNSHSPRPVTKFNEHVTTLENPVLLSSQKNTGGKGNTSTNDISGATGALQTLNYGNSYGQIHIHEGEFLHNKGYTGNNMEMAIMDAGFLSYKTNPAFDSVRLQNRILGTWDFVANEESVNEDHNHGADCFSIIAANRPGAIVGSAPHAKFWLFRTEDVFSETPVEEQNWIAAAEFADSAGAQIFSTSLGYNDFDDPSLNYTYAQRDGNTAMSTRAADLAAKKGILLTVSAGNYGNNPDDSKYVLVPADGDSVLAIGASDVNGNMAAFSSQGPNGAGKVKPNLVSVGLGTVFSASNGATVSGNGTSFANPNMAGLIACLWQAFPASSNMEIIDALQRSAHKFNAPDNRYGNGIPNLRKAYNILMARSFKSAFTYKNAAAGLSWTMNADTSVSFVVERLAPGASQYTLLDSIHDSNVNLLLENFGRIDSIRTTVSGTYTYRIRVMIGRDTSFTSPLYSFTNAWSSIVADSLKLTANVVNCGATINWSMPDDANVTYKLERQLPGMNAFAAIATLKGTSAYGNGASKSYNYTDPISSPVTGTFKYRLQVMLGNDTSFYSKTASFVSLMPCYERSGYFFTPSPFQSNIYAVMNTTEAISNLGIVINDALGRVVYRYRGSKPAGFFNMIIYTSNLSKGVYVASVFGNGKRLYRQKIVK